MMLDGERHVVMWKDVLQQRETTTERLADVIKVIQLGRRTGTLTVERVYENMFEEGRITFIQGQITQANVGARQGQEAMRILQTWQRCLFAFLTATEGVVTDPLPRITTSHTTPLSIREMRNSVPPGRPSISIPINGAPCHIQPVEEALLRLGSMGLSRTHRRLLLLVDGRRCVTELARLVGHTVAEVSQQLRELEQVGFIHL